MIGEFLFIGLVAGLLGLFYRNCLKGKDMILNPIYVVLSRWVDNARFCMEWPKEASEEGYNLKWWHVIGWIEYPVALGSDRINYSSRYFPSDCGELLQVVTQESS